MPHEVDGVEVRYIQVACGAYHTIVVDEDMNVRTFGCGHRGRLGHQPIGMEDSGTSSSRQQEKSKGGLQLTQSRLEYHDMAKPQIVLTLKELGCGGIMSCP